MHSKYTPGPGGPQSPAGPARLGPLPLYFTGGRYRGTRITAAPTRYLLWVETSRTAPPLVRAAARSALGFRALAYDQREGR